MNAAREYLLWLDLSRRRSESPWVSFLGLLLGCDVSGLRWQFCVTTSVTLARLLVVTLLPPDLRDEPK